MLGLDPIKSAAIWGFNLLRGGVNFIRAYPTSPFTHEDMLEVKSGSNIPKIRKLMEPYSSYTLTREWAPGGEPNETFLGSAISEVADVIAKIRDKDNTTTELTQNEKNHFSTFLVIYTNISRKFYNETRQYFFKSQEFLDVIENSCQGKEIDALGEVKQIIRELGRHSQILEEWNKFKTDSWTVGIIATLPKHQLDHFFADPLKDLTITFLEADSSLTMKEVPHSNLYD